jgi:hypothetical protein
MNREIDKEILDKNDYEYTQNEHNKFYLNNRGPKLPEISDILDANSLVDELEGEDRHYHDTNSEENSEAFSNDYNENMGDDNALPFDERNETPLETDPKKYVLFLFSTSFVILAS